MPLLCSLLKSTPKVPTTPVKAKRVSTFQEFESNTSDAWDAGEDDDELLAMATESLNSEVVMETAHRVLRNHSQRQSQPSQKEMTEPEPQPIAEPPVAPSGDLRLVKSVSESHTPCPSGRDKGTVEPRMDWTGIRKDVCLFVAGLWAMRAYRAIFHVAVALPGPANSLIAHVVWMCFSLWSQGHVFYK